MSQGDQPADEILLQADCETLARRVFYSYRGSVSETARGLRLTSFGLEILKRGFESYPIDFRKGYKINAKELMLLDRMCRMPYWLDLVAPKLVVFDRLFATHAALAGGDIALMSQSGSDITHSA